MRFAFPFFFAFAFGTFHKIDNLSFYNGILVDVGDTTCEALCENEPTCKGYTIDSDDCYVYDSFLYPTYLESEGTATYIHLGRNPPGEMSYEQEIPVDVGPNIQLAYLPVSEAHTCVKVCYMMPDCIGIILEPQPGPDQLCSPVLSESTTLIPNSNGAYIFRLPTVRVTIVQSTVPDYCQQSTCGTCSGDCYYEVKVGSQCYSCQFPKGSGPIRTENDELEPVFQEADIVHGVSLVDEKKAYLDNAEEFTASASCKIPEDQLSTNGILRSFLYISIFAPY
jgi:hypothetical protein